MPRCPKSALVKLKHRRLQVTSDYVAAVNVEINIDKTAGDSTNDWVEMALRQLTADSARSDSSSKKSRKWKKRQDFTQSELLAKFKENCIEDEPHVTFDYVGLYLICSRIHCDLAKMNPKWRGPKDLPISPWELVFLLLRHAVAAGKGGDLTPLARAAETMDAVLEEPGISNKFSKQALNRSSGHLSKSHKPKFDTRPYDSAFTSELWQKFEMHSSAMQSLPGISVASASASHLTFYSPRGSKQEFKKLQNITTPFWYLWAIESVDDSLAIYVKLMSNKDGLCYLSDSEDLVAIKKGLPLKALGRKGYEYPRAVVLALMDWHMLANMKYRPGGFFTDAVPHVEYLLEAAKRWPDSN